MDATTDTARMKGTSCVNRMLAEIIRLGRRLIDAAEVPVCGRDVQEQLKTLKAMMREKKILAFV